MKKDEYQTYENEVKQIKKENEGYLNLFYKTLQQKKLSDKTIKKHIDNASFYINEYLTYYDANHMKDGMHAIGIFFDEWFPRKALWSNETSTKETAASLKKFYKCMADHGYVDEEEYNDMCKEIKEFMPMWLLSYKNDTDFDIFF